MKTILELHHCGFYKLTPSGFYQPTTSDNLALVVSTKGPQRNQVGIVNLALINVALFQNLSRHSIWKDARYLAHRH